VDQDFALRWVNKHISKFGGDPAQVAMWGERAGAASVLQHIVANNGQTRSQLSRGAMTSSSFSPPQYNYDDPIPELLYSEVGAQPNCNGAADSMACLRAADVNILATANQNITASAFFGTEILVPVVDGEFITQHYEPSNTLLGSSLNSLPALLYVTNAFEGTIFVDKSTAATANATQYALDLFPNFNPAEADRVGSLYAGLSTQLFQTNAVMGESKLIYPTYFLLRAFVNHSFKGEFAIPPGFHGSDIQYYFPSTAIDAPNIATAPIFNNTAFIDAFTQSFISFAISLDPNIKANPTSLTPKWNK
ncbi:Alpha/Beta hydrolase protein, partial [Mycena capillaripes]